MKFEPRDIVVTTATFGSHTFVILELEENAYWAIRPDSKKKYRVKDSQIESRIGQVAENDPILVEESNWETGSDHAAAMARMFPTDDPQKRLWKLLSELRPGDHIAVIHRKGIYEAEFIRVNVRRPKQVFSAKIMGRQHSFAIHSLVARWEVSNATKMDRARD
jgi:hypothetical protein